MKHAIVFLLLAALAGCTRQADPTASGAAPGARKGPAGNTVGLEPAAQREAGVKVEQVALRSMAQTLRSTARLTNDENQTWRVGAITEGRIVTVLANPGDAVRPGQILARMHSHDIHESRAEYRKAVTELARLRSTAAFAERVRDRAKRLYDLKAGSLEQWEHSETELRNAQLAVANAEVELDRTRNHLVEFLGIPAEDADRGQGHDEDDYIPIRAPAAGVVLTRNITPGTVVTPANDLFVVSNLSQLWAIAEVSEENLPKLRVGMPVRVYVQAYGTEAFPGRIGKLGETLDPATRTVKVRVDLPNPGGRLKPEMYATTEIEMGGSENAVFVPEEATQEVRGQNVVFVRAAPDRFEVRPVQTGRALNGEVEIVRGLQPGEWVAARGSFILKSEFLKAALSEE
ncbi:MAG TPA: efflux RND transporter periplasmic adaptor subunit [Bryobacteraceae bacterium]|nr:efflux RND transporter periplasmic adaptor subunit [Bryobacteraceae bacterium]